MKPCKTHIKRNVRYCLIATECACVCVWVWTVNPTGVRYMTWLDRREYGQCRAVQAINSSQNIVRGNARTNKYFCSLKGGTFNKHSSKNTVFQSGLCDELHLWNVHIPGRRRLDESDESIWSVDPGVQRYKEDLIVSVKMLERKRYWVMERGQLWVDSQLLHSVGG